MKIGFALPVSGSWATPSNVAELARRAEELGYASLWTFQRLLAPVGSTLPPVYRSVLDPLMVLGYAAAVTERVRLGTAIVNMPYLAPAVLAKQLATLDVLSDGRVDAGLGLGWSQEEFAAVGTDYARRGARAEEYLDCLRALWGPDPVEHAGAFYRVPRASVQPKPVQRSGPPILLGATSERALRRIGRLADGWISNSRADLTTLAAPIAQVRAAAQAAGRDPATMRFVCRGVVRDGPRTRPLTGSLDEVRADLPDLAAQGMTEVFLDLNFDPKIGHPDADPAAAMRRAHEVLEALAPDPS
ncbi:TIGR03619 family F420-dependent LLM class oxidoreductase [Georgenia yuyongxinii]|uniref:TIGR03619 family F420-dependent LLM class oxidoreductase n=1 Tax=Georgenia yuyongxinii TaxID=2589797 RepID=A0A5B8C371_9MICO|nr:TIGR03619 family F420-dependent LLM class oxidoreductase [Georgenia yuyongxinii]QDC25023.1 TIGR03619 family F420-dependent LLM class oxidoreductase [Georgenia yuyongxinii]